MVNHMKIVGTQYSKKQHGKCLLNVEVTTNITRTKLIANI